MSDELEYWVLFEGKIRGDHALDELQASFKKAFGVDDTTIKKVFCGKPVVIKPRADEMTAQEFKAQVEAFGGVCWFEPRPDGAEYEDRRQQYRRAQRDRRDQRRDHAILPDRRSSDGRRDEDKE